MAIAPLPTVAMADMAFPRPSNSSLPFGPGPSSSFCGSSSHAPYLRMYQRDPSCLRALHCESVEVVRPRRWSCCRASPSQATEELPPKLQEIVRVFQGVEEPRAKCEQLLHYASKLKPLAEDQKQPENKVEGCVSKVYIVCELRGEDGRVYFEAESDVLLTKGLAGLLVEGLSGVTVEEVLKVTPDFVHMLGLNQSLTPSRSNGFLNMLKLIQKKTLQVYSKSSSLPMTIGNATATVPITSITPTDDHSDPASPLSE